MKIPCCKKSQNIQLIPAPNNFLLKSGLSAMIYLNDFLFFFQASSNSLFSGVKAVKKTTIAEGIHPPSITILKAVVLSKTHISCWFPLPRAKNKAIKNGYKQAGLLKKNVNPTAIDFDFFLSPLSEETAADKGQFPPTPTPKMNLKAIMVPQKVSDSPQVKSPVPKAPNTIKLFVRSKAFFLPRMSPRVPKVNYPIRAPTKTNDFKLEFCSSVLGYLWE